MQEASRAPAHHLTHSRLSLPFSNSLPFCYFHSLPCMRNRKLTSLKELCPHLPFHSHGENQAYLKQIGLGFFKPQSKYEMVLLPKLEIS